MVSAMERIKIKQGDKDPVSGYKKSMSGNESDT